jgi:hypothetical protein
LWFIANLLISYVAAKGEHRVLNTAFPLHAEQRQDPRQTYKTVSR